MSRRRINNFLQSIYYSKIVPKNEQTTRRMLVQEIKSILEPHRDFVALKVIGSSAYNLVIENGDIDLVLLVVNNGDENGNENCNIQRHDGYCTNLKGEIPNEELNEKQYKEKKQSDEQKQNESEKQNDSEKFSEGEKHNEGEKGNILNTYKTYATITESNEKMDVVDEETNIAQKNIAEQLTTKEKLEIEIKLETHNFSLHTQKINDNINTQIYNLNECSSQKSELFYEDNNSHVIYKKVPEAESGLSKVKETEKQQIIHEKKHRIKFLNEEENYISGNDLFEIADLFKNSMFTIENILINATFPIIKLKSKRSKINIDLSINQYSAIENTNLVARILLRYPFIKQTIVLVKTICGIFNINCTYTCTLSSYAITLMTIFYFQITMEIPHIFSKHKCILHEYDLFDNVRGFFFFYGWVFDYEKDVVSVRLAKMIRKSQFRFKIYNERYNLFMCIEDPIVSDFNVTRTVTKENLERIVKVFKTVFHMISNYNTSFFS